MPRTIMENKVCTERDWNFLLQYFKLKKFISLGEESKRNSGMSLLFTLGKTSTIKKN